MEFPGASWLSAQVFRSLEVVGGHAEALIASVARRHGLSHAALNALAVIEGNGAPMTAGAIGAHMHITSGTMTSVLDTLERKGFIRRLTDPDDRRKILVDVTPEAQAVLNRLLPEVVQTTTVVIVGSTTPSSTSSWEPWHVSAMRSLPPQTTCLPRPLVERPAT